MQAADFIRDVSACANPNPNTIPFLMRFFKTAEGQYGAGDQFIGVSVPRVRAVCKEYRDMSLNDIETLLESPIHEVRLGAVILMATQARRTKDAARKKALFNLYIRRIDRINNWDIVDVSCRDVVGGYLLDKPRDVLVQLAKSKNMWERRVAIVSTWEFIRHGDVHDTFVVAALLLSDTHDLIHKATGWMLREAGKKDRAQLLAFLDRYAATMPRTALRYAIEHLPPTQRTYYMQQKSNVKA